MSEDFRQELGPGARRSLSVVNRSSGFSRIDRTRLPQILLIGDLANLLRCSVSTIRRRVRSKTFPVAPLPSIDTKLRWSMDAVCDWIDTCNAPAVPPIGKRAS